MCLIVSEKSNKTVEKVFKRLTKVGRKYKTPFMYIQVPSNGWIIPNKRGTVGDKYSIEGGFVHAYTREQFNYKCYDAYAINVRARGIRDDIICRALYVPTCDVNKERRAETIKFLESKPTVAQIVAKYKFLEKVV